jgi:hypothetical protein
MLQVTTKIHCYESHPHSIIHVLLWMCSLSGVDFDSSCRSQTGEGDVVIINKYHHYLELKAEQGGSVHEAVEQIADKHSESFQQKPAFHYGIKWSEKSTHVTVEVKAEGNAADSDLWKNRLSKGPHIVHAPKSVYLYLFPASFVCEHFLT